MKHLKINSLVLLVIVLSLFMVGAAMLGGLDLVQAQSTDTSPSFEVATTSLPVLTGQGVSLNPSQVDQNETVRISVEAYDVSGLASAVAYVRNSTPGSRPVADVPLFDDGQHGDGTAGDGKFSGTWNVGSNADGIYPVEVQIADRLNNTATISNVVTIAIGVGACASDSQCTTGSRCCGGVCGTDQCASNSQCNDNNAGTSDTCILTSCPSYCSSIPITSCSNNDGFCPASCTSANDNDCADTSAPIIAIGTPATDGTTLSTSPTQIIAQASDGQSGIDRVEFYLDSETAPRDTQYFDQPSGSGTYIWVLNLASVTNGAHTITAKAINGVALTSTATRAVQVSTDSSAPFNVTITSPAQGSIYANTSTINVNIAASDNQSVTEVRVYSLNGGGPLGQATTSGTSVNQQVSISAGAIAAAYDPLWSIAAAEPAKRPLPFISVAHAATGGGQTCTTSTVYTSKWIYAVAYDAAGNNTPSPIVALSISSSVTTCTNSTTDTAPPPTI
ncbi:MAG: Ig-like domain-containing protein [Candidatus Kerfeldbacteria bacterium]|nr:Ig-like domain-containing protein [Candidatus Kerfeldbacteria bacterium]